MRGLLSTARRHEAVRRSHQQFEAQLEICSCADWPQPVHQTSQFECGRSEGHELHRRVRISLRTSGALFRKVAKPPRHAEESERNAAIFSPRVLVSGARAVQDRRVADRSGGALHSLLITAGPASRRRHRSRRADRRLPVPNAIRRAGRDRSDLRAYRRVHCRRDRHGGADSGERVASSRACRCGSQSGASGADLGAP